MLGTLGDVLPALLVGRELAGMGHRCVLHVWDDPRVRALASPAGVTVAPVLTGIAAMDAAPNRLGLVGGPMQRQVDRRRTRRRVSRALRTIAGAPDGADLLVLNSFAWYWGASRVPLELAAIPVALLDTQVVAEPALADLPPLAGMVPMLERVPRLARWVHRHLARAAGHLIGRGSRGPGDGGWVPLPWQQILPRIYAVDWPGTGLQHVAEGVYRGPRLFGDEQELPDPETPLPLSMDRDRPRVLFVTGSLRILPTALQLLQWLDAVRSALQESGVLVDLIVPNTAYDPAEWDSAVRRWTAHTGGTANADAPVRIWHHPRAVPMSWALDRVDALFCHGGAGTTAAAIAAGVPQTGVWFLPEQRRNFATAPNCRVKPISSREAIRSPARVADRIRRLLRLAPTPRRPVAGDPRVTIRACARLLEPRQREPGPR